MEKSAERWGLCPSASHCPLYFALLLAFYQMKKQGENNSKLRSLASAVKKRLIHFLFL